jgi:hypothetical protein
MSANAAAPRIGLLRERHLHASLKRWYAEAGDREEVPVDGFVIDLVRGDLLIEVQTRGFAGMKPKVKALIGRGHRLRVVHPIAVDRWIVQVDADGTVLTRRRSPRHGALADIASELITFPELLANPRFEIDVLLTSEEEYRAFVPGRCWRRRGWTVLERRLVEGIDQVVLSGAEDMARLLPKDLLQPFTTEDLAVRLRRPRRVAQHLAYCLSKVGAIEAVGKRGHSIEYRTTLLTAAALAVPHGKDTK